jgi:hypothetical protein
MFVCVVLKPRRLVYEDQEYGLFTVTLFQKVADEFKQKARDKRFACLAKRIRPSHRSLRDGPFVFLSCFFFQW